MWAKMALVAQSKLAEGAGDDDFYKAKIKTARFYYERLLPRTVMHKQAMLSGAENLMSMAEENFKF